MFLGQFEVLQLLYFLELQYLPFACHRLQVLWLAGAHFSGFPEKCVIVLHAADPLFSRYSLFPFRLSLIHRIQ